jgi:hypothetical protein
MSIKGKVLAATASLALVGGGIAAGALTAGVANAATPSCGDSCVDIFSDMFGDYLTGHPAFLVDSYKQGIAVGTPIILFRESNSDPAEDFVVENEGDVASFYEAGLVNAEVALHYGCISTTDGGPFPECAFSPLNQGIGASPDADLNAYEIEYAPFGAATGNCIGIAAAPTSGEKVTLQPCGVSSKTVWIVDEFDGAEGTGAVLGTGEDFGNGESGGYSDNGNAPLINGADTNFSHPFVLTYPGNGYPTDQPRPQLYVSNLSGFFTGIFPDNSTITADIDSNQVWDAINGPIQG